MKGLERFRDHFRDFADRYVLIGGTACDLAFTEVGLEFRATKDLDIVLCVEAINASFVRAFWAFVKAGGYELHETCPGEKRFYRFKRPKDPAFPGMLELFSRTPDALPAVPGNRYTAVSIDETVSSLSAILLDDDYYAWIHEGRRVVDDVPIVRPEHLIPLKARAWLDFRDRSAEGERVDSREIKKHKNDVFRLYAVIDPEFRASLAPRIREDMLRFLREVAGEESNLQQLGLAFESIGSVLAGLRTIYGLGSEVT